MATQTEVGRHLDLTQAAVSQLVEAGTLPPAARRGGHDLDACRIAYVRHLRGSAAGRDSSRPGSLEAERARLASAQAEAQERRNAVDRKELVSLPEVSGAVQAVIVLAVSRLQQVGARVARGDSKLRRRIEAAVDEALEELAAARVERLDMEAFDDEGDDA